MKKMFILFILATSAWTNPSLWSQMSDANETAVQTEISQILEFQKNAWNAGDIKGYMSYYWESDELTFQSGENRVKGWDVMLSRYETHYPPEKRGKLDFTDIEIHSVCGDTAYVLGRWGLVFQDSTRRGGLFTLLFRRMPRGWRIVLDHTS